MIQQIWSTLGDVLKKEGVEKIFAMSVALHGKDVQEKQVIIDTTVQEKNVTYPTDGKLAIKMMHHLHQIAKTEGIQFRRRYLKEVNPDYAIEITELASVLVLWAFTKNHRLTCGLSSNYLQTPIAQALNVIIGVVAHENSEHDFKTLEVVLAHVNKHRTKPVTEAICDRGYGGKKELDGTKISIPDTQKKRDSKYQKEQKRKKFKRRAAIEPIIGHVKSDHRMQRNNLCLNPHV